MCGYLCVVVPVKRGGAADSSCIRQSSRALSLTGLTTLTRPVSGEKQNFSGNLEILRGIRRLGDFSGKYDIFPGHFREV